MRRARPKSKPEPTIALINIVFLMLIFFMVSSTLARPLDGDLRLVQTQDLEGRAPPDALVLHGDGRLSFEGREIATAEAYLAALPDERRRPDGAVRVVPDRDVLAERLVAVGAALRAAGAQRVMIVTERGLE